MVLKKLEGLSSPEELKGGFSRRLMASRVTDASVLQRASNRLLMILELESHNCGANSLFEYLTYQIFETVVFLGGQKEFDSLLTLLAGDYSLDDLTFFVSESGLKGHFELSQRPDNSVSSILQAFVETVRYKKRSNAYTPGVGSAAYLLGERHILEVFGAALRHPDRSRWIQYCLPRLAAGPLPFLMINRLFHVLMARDYFYKVSELVDFPWNLSRYSSLEAPRVSKPEDIDGTIDTGFLFDPYLAAAIFRLICIRKGVHEATLAGRRQNIVDRVKRNPKLSELFSDLNDKDLSDEELDKKLNEALVALLSLQPTDHSLAVAERIKGGELEVKWKTEAEMRDHFKQKMPAEDQDKEIIHTIASFLTPEKNNGRPALLLLRPRRKRIKVLPLVKTAGQGDHETVHVDQAARGLFDVLPNILPIEMEAYATDTAFRLVNGDSAPYEDRCLLSPFGYGLGLRNGIEQVYFRKRDLPRPLFP